MTKRNKLLLFIIICFALYLIIQLLIWVSGSLTYYYDLVGIIAYEDILRLLDEYNYIIIICIGSCLLTVLSPTKFKLLVFASIIIAFIVLILFDFRYHMILQSCSSSDHQIIQNNFTSIVLWINISTLIMELLLVFFIVKKKDT